MAPTWIGPGRGRGLRYPVNVGQMHTAVLHMPYAAGWVYGDLCLVPVRSTIIGRPRSNHCAVRWAFMSDGPMGGVHVRMSGWQESGCRTWTCNGTEGRLSRNARRDTVNLREAETHRRAFITVAV